MEKVTFKGSSMKDYTEKWNDQNTQAKEFFLKQLDSVTKEELFSIIFETLYMIFIQPDINESRKLTKEYVTSNQINVKIGGDSPLQLIIPYVKRVLHHRELLMKESLKHKKIIGIEKNNLVEQNEALIKLLGKYQKTLASFYKN